MGTNLKKVLLTTAFALLFATCDTSNNKGDSNNTPTITTLATGLKSPVGIAVDSNSVYWTESLDGSTPPYLGETWVKKVGLNGGAVTTLATETGQPNYVNNWSMAIDSLSVYWTQSNQNEQTLKKVALNGGLVTTLATNAPMVLALDPSYVYYTDMGMLTYSGTINRIGKNGGGQLFIATGQGEPRFIAVNSSDVYWVNEWDRTINKVGTGGGSVTTLAILSSQFWEGANPPIIAVDSNYLYYIDYANNNGSINRISVNGGAPTNLASSNLPVGLAIDATDVYWTDKSGHIYKVPKTGGTTTNISVTGSPTFITLDSANVYWVDEPSIKKVAKW